MRALLQHLFQMFMRRCSLGSTADHTADTVDSSRLVSIVHYNRSTITIQAERNIAGLDQPAIAALPDIEVAKGIYCFSFFSL